MAQKVPQSKGLPLLGNAPYFLNDLLFYPETLRKELGNTFQMSIPKYDPIFTFDTDVIQHIMEKNYTNYVKSADYDTLKIMLGKGLLTNEGDDWKLRRKAIQPIMFGEVMSFFIDTMEKHTATLVAEWAKSQDPVAINRPLKRLTLNIATESFFGKSVDALDIDVVHAIDKLNYIGATIMRFPRNQIPLWVPTPMHLQLKYYLKQIDSVVYGVLNSLDSPDADHQHLLGLLLQSPQFDEKQIRDEIVTFMVAGYETTANTLMFTLTLLANHPDIQETLRNEILSKPFDADNWKEWMQQHPYLTAVINESMRLYPPGWIVGRRNLEADEAAGFEIPKDSNIIIDLLLMHRHPDHWDDPNAFKPERFIENPHPNKYVFMPFGGGPRVCIGQQFSRLEQMLFLDRVLRQFRLEPVQTDLELEPLISLNTKRPQQVRFVPVK
jgi:cytochrome P450